MTSVLLVWKTLKTHANICRALSHIIFIWGAQDKSSDTVIPRSRTVFTGRRVLPFDVVYWKTWHTVGSSHSMLDLVLLNCGR